MPLKAKDIRSIAIIGPNANLSRAMAGYYGPASACGGKYPTMIDSIASFLPGASITHAAGVPTVLSDDISKVPAAAAMAKSADVVVLVLGTDLGVARENHDAVNITFSEGQLALAEAVAAAAAKPITVVTLTAVPLDLSPLLKNRKIGAILHAGQPSIQTMGVADLLFGLHSPAGRAVQMIYPESYQHEVSPFDFNMRPGASKWPRPDSPGPCADPYVEPVVPSANCTLGTNPGRTYRFFDGKAVVPFGFGLSYTSWSYKLIAAPQSVTLDGLHELLERTKKETDTHFPKLSEIKAAGQYVINVTNTGDMDADDVVLGFMTPPGAGSGGLPIKFLFAFDRVHVKAGETVSVFLYPSLTDLAAVSLSGERHPLPGEYQVSFGVAEAAPLGMGYVTTSLVALPGRGSHDIVV